MKADLVAFTKKIKGFAEAVEKANTNALREIVVQVGTEVIMLSPVLTGRFRGNWQMTVNVPSHHSLDTEDKTGHHTIADLIQRVGLLSPGEVAYIVNNLTYGENVESLGWQQTPPYAPVRRTQAQFKAIVDAAVAMHRV